MTLFDRFLSIYRQNPNRFKWWPKSNSCERGKYFRAQSWRIVCCVNTLQIHHPAAHYRSSKPSFHGQSKRIQFIIKFNILSFIARIKSITNNKAECNVFRCEVFFPRAFLIAMVYCRTLDSVLIHPFRKMCSPKRLQFDWSPWNAPRRTSV